ncbi:MAG: alpha/beta hydrolase [Bacteroidota bacterium]
MRVEYDIYMMPGLGLNHRIFENLSLNSNNVFALHWSEPQKKETLLAYVWRLAQQINKSSNPIILIGHSFGGVMVQELQKVVQAEKLILISTITSHQELPINLAVVKHFKLHHFTSISFMQFSFHFWGRWHGYDSAYLKALFLDSTGQLSSYYFNWAVKTLVNWKSTGVLCPILRIHGSKDKTFPYKKINQAHTIEGGDHLMVHKKGAAISELINDFLEKKEHSFTAL